AEGGLLIDIKMKKNLVAGYNGSIFNRYTQGVLPKHTIGTDHFFKGKKVDFSTNYSFRSDRNLTRYTDITNFFQNGAIDETWTAEQESMDRRKSHYLNLFLDYQFNDKNTFSFSSINTLTPNLKRDFDSETLITDISGNQTASFLTTNATDFDVFNTSIYLDWLHKLNEKGAELSTNATYTYYDYHRNQQLENRFTGGEDEFLSNDSFTTAADQIINLFSLQTDLTVPLNDNSKMETGLRYAGINSEARIEQTGLDQIRPGTDPTLNGLFNYDEDIYAAYVSLNNNWENWKLNLGLRTEYTETLGVLNSDNSKNTNSYLEWFPSFSLSHTLDTKNSVFLKFYRRINRPRYNSINPFQYFQTVNSIVEGNPNLKPALRNYASLEYSFDHTLRIVLFGSQQNNEQSQQVFQDNTANLLRFQYINLNTNYNAGADVSISKDITDYWNTFFLLSYFYDENRFTDFESNLEQSNSIWTSHIRATNSFKFLSDKSLLVDITYTYFSPLIDGNARQEAFSEFGISLRKTLWNRKASISLAIEDLFKNGNSRSTRDYLQQSNSTYTRRETRVFVFGFRYKFGNTKIRDNYKNKDTDENRRI
ncbi:MAG: outer membrane beta-barrel family protein, partial [Maribacter sp.]